MKKDYSVDEMKKIMGKDMEDTTENINFGQVWQRQQY